MPTDTQKIRIYEWFCFLQASLIASLWPDSTCRFKHVKRRENTVLDVLAVEKKRCVQNPRCRNGSSSLNFFGFGSAQPPWPSHSPLFSGFDSAGFDFAQPPRLRSANTTSLSHNDSISFGYPSFGYAQPPRKLSATGAFHSPLATCLASTPLSQLKTLPERSRRGNLS